MHEQAADSGVHSDPNLHRRGPHWGLPDLYSRNIRRNQLQLLEFRFHLRKFKRGEIDPRNANCKQVDQTEVSARISIMRIGMGSILVWTRTMLPVMVLHRLTVQPCMQLHTGDSQLCEHKVPCCDRDQAALPPRCLTSPHFAQLTVMNSRFKPACLNWGNSQSEPCFKPRHAREIL